jgi:hypothetical protein
MKKVVFLFVIVLNVSLLFSQNIFDENNSKEDLNKVLEDYNRSSNALERIFNNNLLRILLGEKELLDKNLDIFLLAQTDNKYLRLLRNMIYAKYGYILDLFNNPLNQPVIVYDAAN